MSLEDIGRAVADEPTIRYDTVENPDGSEMTRRHLETEVKTYPYESGDVLVLGPGIFASLGDAKVINWLGENYVPQGSEKATYDEKWPWLGAEELARVDALNVARSVLVRRSIARDGEVSGLELALVARYILTGEYEYPPTETDTAELVDDQGGGWRVWGPVSMGATVAAMLILTLNMLGVLPL